MPTQSPPRLGTRAPRRKIGARRAILALMLITAPLLAGCDSSITSFFRQSVQAGIQDTMTIVTDNFFGGISAVLNDDAQSAGAGTSPSNTAATNSAP